MPDAPEWSRIGLAAALSVLTHLVAAGALAGLFGGLTGERAPETAGPPPPDRIPLGIERSSATTITWIGFEEPAPQQARRSTVEQAAQRLGGAPPSPPAAGSSSTRIGGEWTIALATISRRRMPPDSVRA